MLIDRDTSTLMVIDMQQRLLPVIHDWYRVLDNAMWLIALAQRLDVPVIASEQYPRGLGPSHERIRAVVPAAAVFDKVDFSCVTNGRMATQASAGRRQLVLCGIESHVCVLQTALDLCALGRDVFVVADAVGSRHPSDRQLALERMRQQGIEIVSREMVAFEWLRRADTAEFRQISKEFLR